MHVYDRHELMFQQIPSLCLSSLRSYYVSKLTPSVLMTSSSITKTIQRERERERERERNTDEYKFRKSYYKITGINVTEKN